MTLEGNEADKLPDGSKAVEPSKLWNTDGFYDVDSYTWTAAYQNRRDKKLLECKLLTSQNITLRRLRRHEQSSSLTGNSSYSSNPRAAR